MYIRRAPAERAIWQASANNPFAMPCRRYSRRVPDVSRRCPGPGQVLVKRYYGGKPGWNGGHDAGDFAARHHTRNRSDLRFRRIKRSPRLPGARRSFWESLYPPLTLFHFKVRFWQPVKGDSCRGFSFFFGNFCNPIHRCFKLHVQLFFQEVYHYDYLKLIVNTLATPKILSFSFIIR